MEYNQFSDIKGIFKNFFHKKEDFNNKGLISEKGERAAEVWGLRIGLNVGLLCFYVIIASLFGVLPKFDDTPHAVKLFVLMVVIFLGQYGYYYYANGEKEITDFIYKKNTPYVALSLLSILVVIAVAVFRSRVKAAAALKTFIHKYWRLIAVILFIMGGGFVGADIWLGFTGLDFMYTIIITGIIWIIIFMTLLFIRYWSPILIDDAQVVVDAVPEALPQPAERSAPPIGSQNKTPGKREI